MQIYNAISQGIFGKYDEHYADFKTQEQKLSDVAKTEVTVPKSTSTTTTKIVTRTTTTTGKKVTAKKGTPYALRYACASVNSGMSQVGFAPLIGNGSTLPWTMKTMTNDNYACKFQVTNIQKTDKVEELAKTIFTGMSSRLQ